MSHEDVEVVRRSFDAFAQGGLDALAECWAPDIDWRAAEGALDDVGEMHGADAVRRHMQDWLDLFDDINYCLIDARDLGDGRVLAAQHLAGTAKLSGAVTELRYAVVYTVRDGRVVRGREYMTLDGALDAVGLRE